MENPATATNKPGDGPDTPMRGGTVRPSMGTLLVAVAVVLAAAVAIVLWLVLRNGGQSAQAPADTATAASTQRLAAAARSIGHPIYWVGPRPGFVYELSRTKDGRVYIRYLPPGVKVGSRRPGYLTVGTYPQQHAFATLRATAKAQGVPTIALAGGGVAFQDKRRPTSVYLAYPGSDFQIEVFDPSPVRAFELVSSGQLAAVATAATRAAASAASVEQLRTLAMSLGHPIYWAGSQPRVTYELTKTKDGRVYIRYLPAGVSVGDPRPNYLTVGTYPLRHALAILKATAAKSNAATLRLSGGGLGLVDPKHTKSVYVAYPGVDFQVEVYDPSPGRARQLVTSGRIQPVR
jgi:hypothetical protein